MQCWDRPGGPLGKDGDAGTGRRLGSREGMSWGSQRVQEKEGSKERRKGGWEEHTGEKKSTLWRHLLMHRLPPSPRGPPPLLPWGLSTSQHHPHPFLPLLSVPWKGVGGERTFRAPEIPSSLPISLPFLSLPVSSASAIASLVASDHQYLHGKESPP